MIRTVRTIICDLCPAEFAGKAGHAVATAETGHEIRARAWVKGWAYRRSPAGYVDLCPAHRDARW